LNIKTKQEAIAQVMLQAMKRMKGGKQKI